MMGSRLFETFPSYAQTIRELDQVLARLTDSPSWTIEGNERGRRFYLCAYHLY